MAQRGKANSPAVKEDQAAFGRDVQCFTESPDEEGTESHGSSWPSP